MPLNYPSLTVELVNIHFHNLQAKPIKTRNTIERERVVNNFVHCTFFHDSPNCFPTFASVFRPIFFNSYDWKMNSTFGLCDVRQNIT